VTAELGTIEGYYGTPWGWPDREHVIAFLSHHGYRFYIYAPKADRFLRKSWRESHPVEITEKLRSLSARCRSQNVGFGVGLSPYEIYLGFDRAAEDALSRKLEWLDSIGTEILAVLFDDMRGDVPGLAETQVHVMHWIAERTRAQKLIVCPSYYTDDPVLDRFFGQRPENYLSDLGRMLDPKIEVFWTGEEVCASEIGVAHVDRVAAELKRKPFLWDNYPVNDGIRMSPFLHLRAFTGRNAALGSHVVAHAVNPALQPHLSLVPMLTLEAAYNAGNKYAYGQAFEDAARLVLGDALAKRVREDLSFFQDMGLERLGKWGDLLRARYVAVDHPAAREIVSWLDGVYRYRSLDD
jgi:hypothetical protein